jgi:branched-chain amino acid transport system ATP-binding protein
MSEPPLLAVRHLDAFYGDFQALFDLSVDVQAGEAAAVVGANGAGKSTLLSSIAGLIRTRRDAVTFDGAAIGGTPAHTIAARGIALVPEGKALFPSLTVEENLLIGGQLKRPRLLESAPRLRTLSHACRTGTWCRARRCPAGSSRWLRSGAA